jgi:hypothetical protein
MWLLPQLKYLPPYAPSSSVAECIVIHSSPPPFLQSSTTLSIDIICRRVLRHLPSPCPLSSAAMSTGILRRVHCIRRRVHCHPPPCPLSSATPCPPSFSDAVSNFILRRHPRSCTTPSISAGSTVIHRRVHRHPWSPHPASSEIMYIQHHPLTYPSLSSAAMSTVIHCHLYPSSAAVSIVFLRRHVIRHPLPFPP